MNLCLKKIVNSGQEGAEQGALAAAFLKDCPTGGFIPKDYRTAHGDQPKLKVFGLTEMKTEKFPHAVAQNIENSQGTVLFIGSENDITKPEQFVRDMCDRARKPIFNISIQSPSSPRMMVDFIQKNKIETLHISGKIDKAGDDSVFRFTKDFVDKFLTDVIKDSKVGTDETFSTALSGRKA